MKKSHRLLIITFVSLFVGLFQLSAQDIEGVNLGTVIDDEYVQQKFGQDYSKADKETFFNCWYVYVYGKDSLFVDKHRRLTKVVLSSDRFAVNTNDVPGGIHVGQDVDVLLSANFDYCYLEEWENSIYMELAIGYNLGMFALNDKREISIIVMSEFYGDHVDGIGLNQKVSPEMIVSKFGNPSEVRSEYYWDDPVKEYVYRDGDKETILAFSEDFRMVHYSIGSSKFKTFTDHVPGGICVGDPIEKASPLFDSNGRLHYKYVDDFPYLIVENGVIKRIEYFSSD
ncbi:MAG: hypothetical protein MJZ16_09915 [Bacteroidales bacterium]|nr:hypothetical protein [Bacteroidales bacterium]